MSSVSVFVGLDYHEDSIRICVVTPEGRELFNKDAPNSVAIVAERILNLGWPIVVAIEACCGSADFAAELQARTGWSVKLADPAAVMAMKRGRDKTDRGDAFWLADLARVGHLPEVWQPDSVTRQLRRLVRYRQQMAHQRRELKQQLRSVLRDERAHDAPANSWTKKWREWLLKEAKLGVHARFVVEQQIKRLDQIEKDIQEVEQRLELATVNDPFTQALLRYDGIGLITAVTLRAELGTVDRFRHGKQLSRYCGTTPCNRSSGRRQADAGLVRQANHELRTVVIEAAHRLVRWDPKWKTLKQHLINQGKPRSVATAAVANRWLRWLFPQLKAALSPAA